MIYWLAEPSVFKLGLGRNVIIRCYSENRTWRLWRKRLTYFEVLLHVALPC